MRFSVLLRHNLTTLRCLTCQKKLQQIAKVENAAHEQERSTHVPLRYTSGSVEKPAPAPEPESVPQIEEAVHAPIEVLEKTIPVLIEEEDPEEPAPVLVEEDEPEETSRPVLVEDEEPEEPAPVLVEEEEPEATTYVVVEEEEPEETAPVLVEEAESPTAPEPAPAPPTEPEPVSVPAAVEEPVKEPEEVAAPATEEPAHAPASEPEPVPEVKVEVAAVQTPAAEPTAETAISSPAAIPTTETSISPATTAAEPTSTPAVAPATEPTPVAPSVNGHSKNASTSTAVPSLPSTPKRKASRKFSLPGLGKDKSANSSPTGSTRFASQQQKRDKRHSLLGKLKEMFSDNKAKKEKSEAKA